MASQRISKSLFYGGATSGGGDDISSDDSVDDPDFVPLQFDDNESDHGEIGGDSDGDGENLAGPSGVGAGVGGDDGGVGGNAGGVGGDVGDAVDVVVVPEATRGRGRVGRGRERVKVGRKRVRGEWANEKAKRLRNAGAEYVSVVSGKTVAQRKIGQPCKDGCFDKVGEEIIKAVFDSFWDIGSYDKQNAYISQHLRSVPVKRRYTTSEVSTRLNYEYIIKHFDQEFKVCRNAFLAIHDIGEKRLKVHIKRMKQSPTGTPVEDKRGKAPNPKKVTGVKLARVHEHINKLPTTSSHYTRAKSPHRRYLEAGGSIKGLYTKYQIWMRENFLGEEQVTGRFYEKVFTENYNIGFQPPKKDTCTYCDLKKVAIEEKKRNNEDTTEMEQELDRHQRQAKLVQELLTSQRDLNAEEQEHPTKVIAMDLQQTLPCPRITSSVAYYLRKLWVYNFCIFDVTKGHASMFVWDEVTGGRGSDEVASCLMKWLHLRQQEGENFDILRIFCDNCGGQNKNIHVILAALRIIHQKRLLRIEFVYMVSGHSYMPCDRAFGNIEKKIRVAEDIHTTQHYVDLIRTAVNPPFETISMKREDFVDVKVLSKYITKRSTPVPFSSACQLVVSFRYKEGYLIKTDYDFNDFQQNVHECRVMKTSRRYSQKLFNLADVQLPLKYQTERLLNPLKTENLRRFLGFVGQGSHDWLAALIYRQKELQEANLQVSRPDEEDVGSDQENDLMDYDDPAPMASLQ